MSQPITTPEPSEGSNPSPEQPTDTPSWTSYDRPQSWETQGGAPQAGYGAPYATPAPPPYGSYAGPGRPTNTMAIIAMVSGIAGLTVVPVLGSIVAVILGPIARKEIARTGEEGSGMITAGLIMGWIGIGLGVLLLVLAIGAMVLAFGLAASVTAV